MADTHGEKTEKPTQKKLKEAKEKGQVARSRDLNVAVSTLAATAVLATGGPALAHRLAARLIEALTFVASAGTRDIRPEDLPTLVLQNASLIAVGVGPIALIAAVAGVATAAAQGGLHFAPQALQIDLTRLSPARGLKRLGPKLSWVDLLKAIVTAVALGAIALQIGELLAIDALRFPWMATGDAATYGWASTQRLLWRGGFALLAISAADYGIQRWRLTSSLKMTKQEIRDEASSSEGNPQVRARVRKIRREMGRRRMLRATAHATVVITNPTHYAVALEYRRQKHRAPVVVAKGRDLLAQRIRDIARTNGVPIIENPPLARALHQGTDVGDTIPAPLFSAVAEILAYLIRIKQLVM
jgi:flagellar biosynthesis protein FlhB